MSYDGVTWIPLDEYRKGDLVPGTSSDCSSPTPTIYRWVQTDDTICVSMFDGKFKAIYLGGSEYELPCDGNTTLTTGDTKPTGYTYSAMTSAEIGCVTSIGYGTFSYCTSLTSVTISNSVTSIGDSAFRMCSGLTSVTIPNSVTSIEDTAFSDCTSLTSITIPNSVTSIGYSAFDNCTGLTSCTIGNSVTSIGQWAFANTPWYRSYSADTSHQYGNIIYINDVAYQNISSTIASCAFKESTVSISEWALSFCTNLTSVTIPSGVTSIGQYAFYYCTSLTSIVCNATEPPTIGGNVFSNTNNCPIYVPQSSLSAYLSADGWSQYSSRIQAIS